MKTYHNFLYIFINLLAGGIALLALIISYGRNSESDALYFYIIGILTWISASIVLILKSDNHIVRLMYLMSVGFMGVCSVDANFFIHEGNWQSLLVPLFQFASSAFLPCIFFRCFAVYPSTKKFANNNSFRFLVYMPGFLLFFAMLLSYLFGNEYKRSFFLINIPPLIIPNFVFLFIYSIAGQGCLLHTWLFGETRRQRKQAKWLFLGIIIGVVPLTIFNTIPFAFNIDFPYSRYSAYTLIMIMVFYVIAIIRHRLMDIELALNRSTVYALVSSIAIVSYLIISQVLGKIFSGIAPKSGIATTLFSILIVAMLFAPIKQRIQEIIDKFFYQQRYNYHRILINLGKALSTILKLDDLSEIVVNQLNEALNPEFIALILGDGKDHKAHKQIGNSEKIRETLNELGDYAIDEPEKVSKRQLIIPLLIKGNRIGFILLGAKLSGNEYNLEDISLLGALSHEIAIAIENANMYEKLHNRVRYMEEAYSQLIEALKKSHLDVLFPEKPLSDGKDILSELDIIIQTLIGSSNKLRELNELKSQFLSNVSHELRTPLTSIKGYADNLLDCVVGELSEKQKKYVERISQNCERLIKLIKDLLSLSRIEVGKIGFNPLKFQLSLFIEDIVSDFLSIANKKGVSLSFECSPDLFIYADIDKLREIIINLVDNAIKFNKQEGKVFIYVSDKGDNFEISVKDTGIGISPENLELIFDRYHQHMPKTETSGMGIGLAIVKSLVQIHNGSISVYSELGIGSCFTVSIPKIQDDAEKHSSGLC